MASITLVRTASFSIYQRSKNIYCNWLRNHIGVDVMRHVSNPGSLPNLWTIGTFGAAGATAGSCITLIACELLWPLLPIIFIQIGFGPADTRSPYHARPVRAYEAQCSGVGTGIR